MLILWVLALLAWRAGVSPGFALLVLVWGAILVVLGVTQTQWLPGAAHWVIQVIHLLVGLATMGLGERLATMSKQNQAAAWPAA